MYNGYVLHWGSQKQQPRLLKYHKIPPLPITATSKDTPFKHVILHWLHWIPLSSSWSSEWKQQYVCIHLHTSKKAIRSMKRLPGSAVSVSSCGSVVCTKVPASAADGDYSCALRACFKQLELACEREFRLHLFCHSCMSLTLALSIARYEILYKYNISTITVNSNSMFLGFFFKVGVMQFYSLALSSLLAFLTVVSDINVMWVFCC